MWVSPNRPRWLAGDLANAVAGRQAPPVALNRLSLWVWDGSVSPCAAEVQCCSSCGTRVHYTMHVPQGKTMHGWLSSVYRDERVRLARMRHCMSACHVRLPRSLRTVSQSIRGLHAGGWVACPRNMGEQKYLSLYSVRGRDCNIPGAGRGIVQRRQIATVQGHRSTVNLASDSLDQ